MKEVLRLSTSLGTLFMYVICILSSGFFLFLVYSLITQNIVATILISLLLLMFYLKFLRKIFKYKEITFDSNNIYFNDEFVSLSCITELSTGRIIFVKDGIERTIYFNSYFLGKNHILLKNTIDKQRGG